MQQFIGISLKTRLYLLVLAAFIPVSGLIFYIAVENRAEETGAILEKTLVLTRAAAIEENLDLEFTGNLLATVADAFLMFGDRPSELTALLTNLARRSEGYVTIGILDTTGRAVAVSSPMDDGETFAARSWFIDVLQTKAMAMGTYRGEAIDGEPVLYFALPACDIRGEVAAVVYTAVDLNWMNRNMFKHLVALPRGSRLILLDDNSGIVRYDADSGKWSVPESFPKALHRQIASCRSGTLNWTDEKGDVWIYACAPLSSDFREHPVTMVLGMPRALALGASNWNFIRNVVLLLVSALMAVVFIWWAGDYYILRRIGRIVRVSRELAAGDLDARIGRIGAHDEMGHLGGVFDEMAEALQRRIRNEEQVMASLTESRQQLRNLAAYQQEVREAERIRIAREIHDQFGQSLTILKMDLSWLRKRIVGGEGGVDDKLAGMDRVVDEALETLHTITAELRPVILDDFGLSAAIEWQVEEFKNRSGIDCTMEQTGFEPDLPRDQETALFRIFQELLTNIARHANARKTVVSLREAAGEVVLEVRDDGRGITEAEVNDGASYGLIGIRERLHPWSGRVSFEGRPGGGTRVTVMLRAGRKGDTP